MAEQFGRYKIISELGIGGMGKVYHAHDPRFQRDVAVKVLPPEFMHDPKFGARFEREATTIAALEHPHILPVYDYGEEERQPYLVMRYLPGGSLADRLESGPLGLGEAAKVLREIGEALDYAHENGVIHRDLKPGNILFDQDGRAVLTDFGIARITEASASLTGTSAVIGTPAYMSPEQVHGDKELDGRTDVYALGVTFFEMLSGRQPYHADTPSKVMMKHVLDPIPNILDKNPDLPQACQTVVATAMAKDQDDRYTTATALAQEVEEILAEQDTERRVLPETVVDEDPTLGETFVEAPTPVLEVVRDPEVPVVEPIQELPGAPEKAVERRPVSRWLPIGGGILIVGILIAVGASSLRPSGDDLERDAPIPAVKNPTSTLTSAELEEPTTVSEPIVVETEVFGGELFLDSHDVPMVYVPGGEFEMGSEQGRGDESPAHQVTLGGFYIDRTEVTNAQYAGCVADFLCESPVSSISFTRDQYYGNVEYKDYPVINVTWENAVTYCEWRGARLPTEAEWEKAARGEDGLDYPWGNEFDGTKLNFCDSLCPSDNANLSYKDGFEDTSPVGSYPEGSSPYYALDMAGNVWEWVEDWYGESYYQESPAENPSGPSSGEKRVVRGGSWFYGESFARTSFRHSFEPTNYYTFVGFRCASDTLP